MSGDTFTYQSRFDVPAHVLFDWHKRPGAFERLAPPWEHIEVLERTGTIRTGDRVRLRMRMMGLPVTWLVEHRDYVEGERFRDVQIEGPMRRWEHTHRIEPRGDEACELIDEIRYELPGGALGRALGARLAREKLERMFAYRHRLIARDLADHREAGGRTLTVAVTGSHGLMGSALIPLLTTGGHRVKRIVRSTPKGEGEIGWSPRDNTIDAAGLEGVDAVVHLAGEPIFGRWSDAKKQRIRRSRVDGTRTLADAIARLDRQPAVLVSASAIGYYGDRGAELLDETSPAGEGFLAEVCVEWERATQPAAEAGVRVAMTRFGLILTPRGGGLGAMLPAFRMGAGGTLGRGEQWMSWVTQNDALGAIYHALLDGRVAGPVNVVSPEPVTNRDFTRTLGRVLRRPTLVPVPRTAARLALGELADEGLFTSARVRPARLERTGYTFRNPQLEPALRELLGR